MAESIKIKGVLRSQISDGDKISKKWMGCLDWERYTNILISALECMNFKYSPSPTENWKTAHSILIWGLLTNKIFSHLLFKSRLTIIVKVWR